MNGRVDRGYGVKKARGSETVDIRRNVCFR